MSRYGVFVGDTDELTEQDWVIDPRIARAHVGHRCTVSIYAGRNLAIECEDCYTVIGDVDFTEHSPQMSSLMRRYGAESEDDLLRAIADEYTRECVDVDAGEEPYTVEDARLLLDQMLEAEYQHIAGGA